MSEESRALLTKRIRVTGWSGSIIGSLGLLTEPAAMLWVNAYRPEIITNSFIGKLDPISTNLSFLTVFGIPIAVFLLTFSLALRARIREDQNRENNRLGPQQIIFATGTLTAIILLPISLAFSFSLPALLR